MTVTGFGERAARPSLQLFHGEKRSAGGRRGGSINHGTRDHRRRDSSVRPLRRPVGFGDGLVTLVRVCSVVVVLCGLFVLLCCCVVLCVVFCGVVRVGVLVCLGCF